MEARRLAVRYDFVVIVRLLTKRNHVAGALFSSAAAAIALAVVALNDVHSLGLGWPTRASFVAVALLIGLAGIAPWLVWRARGRSALLRCEEGAIRVGRTRFSAADLTAFSVVKGARGASVALVRGRKVAFLEVERADDVAAIRASLVAKANATRERFGVLPARERRRAIFAFLAQGMVSLATIVAAVTYASATLSADGFGNKTVSGVAGVVLAQVALGLFGARVLGRRPLGMALGSSAYDAHLALHDEPSVPVTKAEKVVSNEASDVREDAAGTGVAEADARSERVRVAVLARGNEPVAAWLARLDAIPSGEGAYRGDAMKKDVLWETLADEASPFDARMAAARVLRRRYGEDEQSLVRVVVDPDERVRVEAALDERDEAEARLEALGPLFRAR